ncbi:conserved hypothetical protein [Verticillium alfalfae VaMs.102]|uniref:C2H2-type domain-containing protein n=1 Tax=Verticillium alfalfae (strain VaMs.102 / ATCC MYA-4576 / FGSC 10136) TaxID=526221 RepID=C9SE90_VERA1|nr:conserved hypothetical protein [Verticillium alfalfae VaMs.102]EEY17314.1 conserved hypothetical protein [Verticillium alfalfae VaMs.102]
MDLTPPSLTRSPVSPPNTYCASESSSLDYPSPGFLSQRYRIAAGYGAPAACSTAVPLDTDNTLPRLACRASSEWSSSSIATPVLASSASTIPNVVSLDYDPFGSYDAHIHTSYGHESYPAPPSARESGSAHAVHSPPSSMVHSPPLASSRVALPFPHGGGHTSSAASGQRIKLETYNDFGSGGIDLSGYTSPRACTATYGSEDTTPYSGSAPAYFSSGHVPHWARSDIDVESTSYDGGLGHVGGLEQVSAQQQQQQQARQNRPRRAPRRLTTREEANFQCEVKGCGKLFSRSYNFKAHMETHDDKREYPFPCQIGDCNKRFVRKTDLQRHHQSVHTKERNHKCDYCSRLFARKDTLRRHMEDGCSRRFDLGTLDLRSEGYNSSSSSRRQLPGTSTGAAEFGVPSHGTLPPLLVGPAGGGEATPAQSNLDTRHVGPASDAGSRRRM